MFDQLRAEADNDSKIMAKPVYFSSCLEFSKRLITHVDRSPRLGEWTRGMRQKINHKRGESGMTRPNGYEGFRRKPMTIARSLVRC